MPPSWTPSISAGRTASTKGLRAIELARALADDLHSELAGPQSGRLGVDRATGEREQARSHAAAALAAAERLRERWWLASASYDNELLSLYEGDWRGAREMAELGLAAQPRDPRHLALRAVLEYEIGDFEAGAAYIARLQEVAAERAAAGTDRGPRLPRRH